MAATFHRRAARARPRRQIAKQGAREALSEKEIRKCTPVEDTKRGGRCTLTFPHVYNVLPCVGIQYPDRIDGDGDIH